MGTKSSAKHNN